MFISQAKLLWHMCVFEAQRFRAFPLELFASLLARLIEAALYITFWLLVGTLSSNQNINAIDVISYYLIISGLTPFFYSGFGIGSQTIKLIKSGELNQTLIRPVNPIFFPWALRTGRNLVNLIFGMVQVLTGIIIAGGVSVSSLPFLIPVVFNMLLINIALNITVGTFAFYFTEAQGAKNVVYHIANFCRGGLMPLHLMPASVAGFLAFTPFPASQYHLTILLQGTRLPSWIDVAIGCLWAVVLLAFSIAFWQRGLKRYEAIGM